MSCWIRLARGSGMSSCCADDATPRSRPHGHWPRGKCGIVWSGSSHRIAAPGAPGCLPRFRFPAARCSARRCFRGGVRPGTSSEDGGIELFPLLRDCARSSRATCSRSAAIWSACAPTASRSSPARSSSSAIRASRAAQAAQSGAAGGRADTSHDHPEPAVSKQADTLSRPAEPASSTTCHQDAQPVRVLM